MVMVQARGPLYWPWDAGNGPGESWPFRDPIYQGCWTAGVAQAYIQSAESYAREEEIVIPGVRGHRPDYGPAADPGKGPCERGL